VPFHHDVSGLAQPKSNGKLINVTVFSFKKPFLTRLEALPEFSHDILHLSQSQVFTIWQLSFCLVVLYTSQ
jgi:hypothetical protein